uniref:Integrin, alpha L (Antigen CD11A (p180), lymphocyte function-associated antigen 1, alpha polypeptide) n=1 Tax=Nothobranchius kuhntae TaxID=321403 RepID=A0A1A8I5U1_NOTKU
MAAAAVISVSSAFNIDVTHSTVHSGEQKDFFGYKVLQFRSSENKGIIITAPLRSNGSGGIFRQAQDKKENWFSPDDLSETNSTFIKHLGLSIAADPTGSQFTVCSPSLVHECHKNSYLNSLCYNITDDLQQVSSFTPLFQKCTKKTVNLVFLFDGSASMTKAEFNKNKDFINEIMINLKNTSIKFAAVQFSLTFRTVFDFKDYDAGKALEKLNKEQHMKSLTNTHGALEDVAVGAPLEDENRGAVYIFLGEKRRGIRGTFSQRINGKNFQPEIRFFGQAIDGVIDLGDDELPDIVVGSQGAAVVLRSKPVFNATAQLSFHPGVISTEKIDCVNKKDENLPMVNLTACFEMVEATKSKEEAMRLGLNISFTLSLDPSRPKNRAFFLQNEKKVQSLTTTHELRVGKTCFEYPTYMQYCVVDTLSPINIKLNFSQADAGSSGAMLNIDSKNQALMKIPFERQCSKNDTCVAQLTVDLDFLSKTILVTEDNYFNVSVTLANHGDDSYNTTLTMHYPPGLSFSKLEVTKSSRPTLHACYDLEEVLDKTVCGISLPVYRSKSSTTFQSSFRVAKDFEWNDKISLTVTGKSDNSNSSEIDWMTKSIPVQYQIRMALTVNEDTVTYLNFTTDDPAPQNMHVKYKIDNTGFKDFPVNVSILLPTKLEHSFEVISYEVIVQEDKTQCSIQPDLKKHESCSPENSCVVIRCDSLILERFSGVELSLVGKVHFKDLRQHAANIAFLKRYTGENGEVKFWSLLKVDYDPKRFVLASHKQEKSSPKNENPQKNGMCKDNNPTIKCTNVRVEFIIPPNKLLIILTGAGLGLLLLIILTVIMWKLGCFKRKTMEYYQEQEDKVSWENGSPANFNPDFSSRMMSISETDKKIRPTSRRKAASGCREDQRTLRVGYKGLI